MKTRFMLAVLALGLLSACNSTPAKAPAPAEPVDPQARLDQQVANAKADCAKTTQNRAQWYRCWIPKYEAAYANAGYPHMDLLKVHTSEMMLIARSYERGAFTPEQTDAMMAQSDLRFNKAVADREDQSRERELDSWRQFRQYIQNPY